MPAFEPASWGVKRQQQAAREWEDFSYASPDDVLQVDAVRDAQRALPSQFGQDMTRVAAALAAQREADRRAKMHEAAVAARRTSPQGQYRQTEDYFRAVDRATTQGPMQPYQYQQIGRSVAGVGSDQQDDGYNSAIMELQARGTPDSIREVGKLQYQRSQGVPFEQAQYGEDLSAGAFARGGLKALGTVGRLADTPVVQGNMVAEELTRPTNYLGGGIRAISFAPKAGLGVRLGAEMVASGLGRAAGEEVYERTENPWLAAAAGMGAAVGGGFAAARAGTKWAGQGYPVGMSLREFDDPTAETVRLYRGDSTPIENFSLSRADQDALFGRGIYFTDNPKVAAAYTTKNADAPSAWAWDASTPAQAYKEAVENAAIGRLGVEAARSGVRSRSSTQLWKEAPQEVKDRYLREAMEYLGSRAEVDIRRMQHGAYQVTRKSPRGTVTEVNIPEGIFKTMVDAEKPMSSEVAFALRRATESVFGAGSDAAETAAILAGKFDREGLFSLANERATRTFTGSPGRHVGFGDAYQYLQSVASTEVEKAALQTAIRRELTSMGYNGIRYDGGVRMPAPGARRVRHNAYVLWDEQGLNRLIRATKEGKPAVTGQPLGGMRRIRGGSDIPDDLGVRDVGEEGAEGIARQADEIAVPDRPFGELANRGASSQASMTPQERALFQRMQQAQGGSAQPTAQRIIPEQQQAGWARDPQLKAAVEQVQDALRGEINLRRSGVVEREIRAGRAVQARRVEDALRAAREGTADEMLRAARSGARVGSLRQTFPAPMEITEQAKGNISRYLIDHTESSFDKWGGLRALDRLYQGENVLPSEIKLLARVFGDDFAKVAADAVRGRPSPVARLTAESQDEIARALKGERAIVRLEQRAKAQERLADDLLEQYRLNPTDRRLQTTSMQARERGLKFQNEADELAIERGRVLGEQLEAANVRRAAREAARTAQREARVAERIENIRVREDIANIRQSARLTEADLKVIAEASEQGEAGVRRLELLAQNRRQAADRLAQEASQRGDTRYAERAADARMQADTLADQADELLRQQTQTRNVAAEARQGRATARRDALDAARATREASKPGRFIETEQSLIAEAKALLGEQVGVSAALDQEAIKTVDQWVTLARQYREAIGETNHLTARRIQAAVSGDLADAYLTSLYQQRLVAVRALEASGTDPQVARQVADVLAESQLKARYPGGVPKAMQAEIDKIDDVVAGIPGGVSDDVLKQYEQAKTTLREMFPGGTPKRLLDEIDKTKLNVQGDSIDQVIEGFGAFSQEWKNLAFGPLDFGIAGQQAFKAVTNTGAINIATGLANRLLGRVNLAFFDDPLIDGATGVARRIQYARDGLGVGVNTGAVQPKEGIGLLGKLGPGGRAVERWIDYNTQLQFGKVMGALRELDYEGNLAILQATGKDITDPAVRATAARFANTATSMGQGALSARRGAVERGLMMTPSMRRAQVQNLLEMAKAINPASGATAEERLLGSVLIVNKFVAWTAIGMTLNHFFGVGDFVWDRSQLGAGTITTGMKGEDGANVVVQVGPQEQVMNAVAQSMRNIGEADLQELGKVWAKLGMGTSGPLLGSLLKAGGFGYQPGRGYRFGDWGEGMSGGKRALAAVAPLPPIVGEAAFEGLSPATAGLETVGFQSYEEAPSVAARGGRFQELTGRNQFNAINAETWRIASEQPSLQRMMGDADTYGQWYQQTYQQVYDAKIKAGKPPMLAADEAQAAVQQHPLYQAYNELRTFYRTNWIKQNPEDAVKFANEQAALPFDEQAWRPTKAQKDLMESYLQSVAR